MPEERASYSAESEDYYEVGPGRSDGPGSKTEMDVIEEETPFAIEVHTSIIDQVRDREDFAGNYFDFTGETDTAYLRLVNPDDEEVEEFKTRLEESGVEGELEVIAARYSLVELMAVAESVAEDWSDTFPRVDMYEVAIDVRQNALTVYVDKEAMQQERRERSLEEEFNVDPDLRLAAGEPDVEQHHCSLRGHCTNPMHAGNRIFAGHEDGNTCGMGFHVNTGPWKRFLTAGHCSWGSKPDDWYHPGLAGNGYLGDVVETAYGAPSGSRDAMVVSMPDVHVSNVLFYDSRHIIGSISVSDGQSVCMQRAQTGGPHSICGTVIDEWTYWQGDGCGCYNWGARQSGIYTDRGDSGSPLFYPLNSNDVFAAGIHNTSGGAFAKVGDAIANLSTVDGVYTG